MVLGDVEGIEEGQTVVATGDILSVPVGDGLLGRVVNLLGEPVDGKGPLTNRFPPYGDPGAGHHRSQAGARADADRHQVDRLLIPVTWPARVDHRRPQDRQDHHCARHDPEPEGSGREVVYVAIGQKASTVAQSVATLEELGHGVQIHRRGRPGFRPGTVQDLAPYGGCAMGQHWMENGEHSLIVYDDLSKQAEAYRQVSLLLRRLPGREAFLGDVFPTASRAPPGRARRFAHRTPGHRDQGRRRVGVHSPNVISITDGQIFLQDDLFKSGIRPAVDVGISVSRVGSAAQVKAMKTAPALKGDLQQFRELEAFAAFGSDLDAVSKAQLERGYRLTELLKQGVNSPYPVDEQTVSIYAGICVVDALPVEDVLRAELLSGSAPATPTS